MGRDVNDDRKRALVMGKFKFLYQDETEDLEAGDKFKLAVIQNKLLGPVQYFDKDGKDSDVLNIYGKERDKGEGFAKPDIKIPGVLDLFTVVWSNPFGDISVDQDIKLFEFEDIQKYSSYNDGPKSKEFCRFYTSSASKELDGFDSSIFWSAGLLHKHFKTCGVEKWDLEMRELVDHYKNWKAWTHEVHNLPNNNNKQFSDNSYSGPASTSTTYCRTRQLSGEQKNSSECTSTSKKRQPPHFNPATLSKNSVMKSHSQSPVPVLTAPPAGQTVLVPIPGPDGSLVQVQLSTLPVISSGSPVTVPDMSSSSRFKYVNPNLVSNVRMLNTSQPPPGYSCHQTEINATSSSSWTNQVDEFLHRPKCSGESKLAAPNVVIKSLNQPFTSKLKKDQTSVFEGKRKVKSVKRSKSNIQEDAPDLESTPVKVRKIDKAKNYDRIEDRKASEESRAKICKAKFKPKASIMPPSPGNKTEVNELDISPEKKLYSGKIIDWKGKFGFISCPEISGKIFVHSKDIVEGRNKACLAAKAVFQVLHQDSSVVGAKAVNVKISS